jgi:UDP-N-acetylglucosamine:LPS N-acetylglucosamine transferase
MTKILIVTSVGGHLDEIMQLAPALRAHEVVLVVNERCDLPDFPFTRVYRIAHAERDWRVLKNFAEAAQILHAENPDLLVSAGAGPIVPFACLARLAKRARIVFVETAAAVRRPTLTGRLMSRLADDTFYQWDRLARSFPRGRKAELVFR